MKAFLKHVELELLQIPFPYFEYDEEGCKYVPISTICLVASIFVQVAEKLHISQKQIDEATDLFNFVVTMLEKSGFAHFDQTKNIQEIFYWMRVGA